MSDAKSKLELLATTVQVVSVVAGVAISVQQFTDARKKEAEVKKKKRERGKSRQQNPSISCVRIYTQKL